MQQSLILLFLMGQCCLITCHLYEYRYVDEKKNWSEAQKFCRKKFTDLATVSNMTDMKRLYDLVKNKKKAWIGLYNETDGNRTWHWSLPGVEFNDSETRWDDNEPNNPGGKKPENCVTINNRLLWHDNICQNKKAFLCCNESNGSHTFHLIDEEKTWWDAQKYCREYYTDLVSGLQQLEDAVLKKLVGNSGKDHIFIGLFRDTWRWSDGSSFSFRNWDSKIIDYEDGKSDQCAMMMKDSNTWKTRHCIIPKRFFCYDDNVILIQKQMNWEDALYYCREHHHDLVSITSLDEQRWVQEKAKKATTSHVWTGLRYTCTLDFWFWVSDERVSYENWASGQDGNDCDMSGAMETRGQHQWVKINDNEKMNFICFKS